MRGVVSVPPDATHVDNKPETSAASLAQPGSQQPAKKQRISVTPVPDTKQEATISESSANVIPAPVATPYNHVSNISSTTSSATYSASTTGNLCLKTTPVKKKAKVLLLCAGPNDRDQSIYKLLVKAGFEVDNFDLVNGDGNDIADKAVFDRICRAVTAKDYVAAFASPDCSTFSKARSMPGGPPPVRGIEGRDRYGLKVYGTRVTSAPKQPLSREDKENVRYHTLVAVRVAFILDLCWTQTIPFGHETPERCAGQVSMLHLDEYIALLARPGVKHKVGFQCPFDGVSAKPTSWVVLWHQL